jgi:hypothetical protein
MRREELENVATWREAQHPYLHSQGRSAESASRRPVIWVHARQTAALLKAFFLRFKPEVAYKDGDNMNNVDEESKTTMVIYR